mmetsp:Transcript_91439/g.285010  ORF Transcript_91439/g.285010 Transcript_91439/m.285010 type:complete len:341 (-) Transcript_91439:221-1243(-)
MAEERVAMKIEEALEPGGGDAAAGGPPDGAPWGRPDEGVPSSRRSAACLRRARRARACWMAGLRRGIAMDGLDADALRVGRTEAGRRARTSGGTPAQHWQFEDSEKELVDVSRRFEDQERRTTDARYLQEELRAVLASRGAMQKERATMSRLLEREPRDLEATSRQTGAFGRQRTRQEVAWGMQQVRQRAEHVTEQALKIEEELEELAGLVAAAALVAKKLAAGPGPRLALAEYARAGSACSFPGETQTGAQESQGFFGPIRSGGTDPAVLEALRDGKIAHGQRVQDRGSDQAIVDAGLQLKGSLDSMLALFLDVRSLGSVRQAFWRHVQLIDRLVASVL